MSAPIMRLIFQRPVVTEQSVSSQTPLTENLNMRRTAPSPRQRARPHVPENHSL
jgi:hypothetical protein